MSAEERRLGVEAAEQARAELYDTLGKLTHQLNYARRIDESIDRGKARLLEVKATKPGAFVAGVAGVAAVAGLVVWGVVRAASKRL